MPAARAVRIAPEEPGTLRHLARKLRGLRSAHQVAMGSGVSADSIRQFEVGRALSVPKVVTLLRYLKADLSSFERHLDTRIQAQLAHRDLAERAVFKERFLEELEASPALAASARRRQVGALAELAEGDLEGEIAEPAGRVAGKARPASSVDRATVLWLRGHSALRTSFVPSATIPGTIAA